MRRYLPRTLTNLLVGVRVLSSGLNVFPKSVDVLVNYLKTFSYFSYVWYDLQKLILLCELQPLQET